MGVSSASSDNPEVLHQDSSICNEENNEKSENFKNINKFPVNVPVDTTKSCEVMRSEIMNLVKKSDASSKDLLNVILQIFTILCDQNNQIQSALKVLHESQMSKEDRLTKLEKEICDLRKVYSSNSTSTDSGISSRHSNASDNNIDPFQEFHERNFRANNAIIFSLEESMSKVTPERIEHDKSQISNILNVMELNETGSFKVNRLGHHKNAPRPLRVTFSNSATAKQFFMNRHKVLDLGINIRQDLTHLQRNHLKKLYEEVNERKRNGENNIGIRYKNGIPYIGQFKSQSVRNLKENPKNDLNQI